MSEAESDDIHYSRNTTVDFRTLLQYMFLHLPVVQLRQNWSIFIFPAEQRQDE